MNNEHLLFIAYFVIAIIIAFTAWFINIRLQVQDVDKNTAANKTDWVYIFAIAYPLVIAAFPLILIFYFASKLLKALEEKIIKHSKK